MKQERIPVSKIKGMVTEQVSHKILLKKLMQ